MYEKEFEEKQEQQEKADSVQEEQAVESAQEEPISVEDTTEDDRKPEEKKTGPSVEKTPEGKKHSAKKDKEEKADDMTEEEAFEKAKASILAREKREKEKEARQMIDNANKKSLLKRIGLGIVNVMKKVAYVALTPVRWVGDRAIELTMPKESRAKMYNDCLLYTSDAADD